METNFQYFRKIIYLKLLVYSSGFVDRFDTRNLPATAQIISLRVRFKIFNVRAYRRE